MTKPFGRNELVARIQAQLRTREFSQARRMRCLCGWLLTVNVCLAVDGFHASAVLAPACCACCGKRVDVALPPCFTVPSPVLPLHRLLSPPLFCPCLQGVRPSFVASCLSQQPQDQQAAQQQAAQQPVADSMCRDGNRRLSLPVTERAAAPSPPQPGALSAPRLSAPAAVEAVPASAAGAAAAVEPPAQQATVQELQRQLLDAQQQLAAMAALQASTAAAAAAAAAGQPSEDVLNGRSDSGSVESGTPERLSGDAPPPAVADPCSPAGCCQPAVSPPLSVEAVRSSD